jgi:SOS-response transcriptional repressor LexA
MLTNKQRAILELYHAAERERRAAPTVREVADALGKSNGTVWEHIQRLVRDGWLERPHDGAKPVEVEKVSGCTVRKRFVAGGQRHMQPYRLTTRALSTLRRAARGAQR